MAGASFSTRKFLLRFPVGCKMCPDIHASYDSNSQYFQKKMDTLWASAEVDVRNQCVRTALSSLADTFLRDMLTVLI